mmetsp:Transcript_21627/g.28959  ORF Transcript_21627/g.28959 Transcript_21627/m.28959 type:complete len:165 (-) Transcript_21627:379-873(-)
MQRWEFFQHVFMILVMTSIYFSPRIFNKERNPVCEMNTPLANVLFGWVVLGLDGCISLGWIIAYAFKRARSTPSQLMFEFVERATIGQAVAKAVIQLFGLGLFFIVSQIMLWPDMAHECLEGINLLDFIVYCCLLFITVKNAIALSACCCAAIICCPCICMAWS